MVVGLFCRVVDGSGFILGCSWLWWLVVDLFWVVVSGGRYW